MTHQISIIKAQDAETLWVLGDEIKFMGTMPDGELSVVEVTVPPGSGTPPHSHQSLEIFRVSEGEITFGLFGDGPPRELVAGPGTVLMIPSMAVHNYHNASGMPAKMTVVLEVQMLRFFRELGRAERPEAGPPTEDQIAQAMAACARHGIEIMMPKAA